MKHGIDFIDFKNAHEYMNLIGNTRTKNSSLSNPTFITFFLSLHDLNLFDFVTGNHDISVSPLFRRKALLSISFDFTDFDHFRGSFFSLS